MAANPASSLCPNCGEFVHSLHVDTGWCRECSGIVADSDADKLETWLVRNADALEHYMVQGNSLTKAVDLVAENIRPVCLVCGKPMNRARRGSIFCRHTKECARYYRRYVYFYQQKGMSKPQALAAIMRELEV